MQKESLRACATFIAAFLLTFFKPGEAIMAVSMAKKMLKDRLEANTNA